MRPALVITGVLLVSGLMACSREQRSVPQTYHLNSSAVRLVPPNGWEHVRYGREHLFRHGRGRVTLEIMNAHPHPPNVEAILQKLGHNSQRSIASMRTVVVNDVEVVVVETWDHLSHASPMRFALAPCDNRQLVLHTRHGSYEESIKAFDTVLASIEIIGSDSRP